MLLKCSRASTTVPVKGKGKLTRGGTVMRVTMSTGSTMSSRVHRKVIRIPSKRHPGKTISGKLHSMVRPGTGKIPPGKRIATTRTTPAHCDNSNDSGLGFDHVETPFTTTLRNIAPTRGSINISSKHRSVTTVNPIASAKINNRSGVSSKRVTESTIITDKKPSTAVTTAAKIIIRPSVKRVKTENSTIVHDDTCSNDAFIFSQQQIKRKCIDGLMTMEPMTSKLTPAKNTVNLVSSSLARATPRPAIRRPPGLMTLQSQVGTVTSKDGKYSLSILAQPEQQHRARYQTEGSRGAVKDRSGNGFPIVKLAGYNKPAILEIFIGTDIGRVAPHMFYQACKVSGKNSTQCVEKKIDGTFVIEIELKPENDMTATCDCVGILKERNVDVEHRFPDHTGPRNKKKSTRCRMVFRTHLTRDDDSVETIQICSQQIICTQPPGIPEICKKSISSCPSTGGLELFIFGKNFLKDTRVVFEDIPPPNFRKDIDNLWQQAVLPDKEFLQQTHLVCTVPPYHHPGILDPVDVHVYVQSSNKTSEMYSFLYTPKEPPHGLFLSHSPSTSSGSVGTMQNIASDQDMRFAADESSNSACPMMIWNPTIEPMNAIDSGMMPPPSTLPLSVRRPSAAGALMTDQISPPLLKSEIMDESSQGSIPDMMSHDSMDHISGSNENSMDGSPIKDMQFVQQRIRKHSIDIMDNNSMMVNSNSMDMVIHHDTNSMGAFSSHDSRMSMMSMDNSPEMKVVDLRVKQEQMAAQLQQYINNGTDSDSSMMPVVPNAPSVNKFLSNLKTTVTNLNPQVESAVAAALYASSNSNNNSDVIFTQQDMNQIQATTNAKMDQTFTHNLMTEAGSSSMSQILTFPSDSSPVHNTSPISQDIILNSPATLSSTGNLTIMPPSQNPSTTAQNGLSMSSDIILNPTVSPTMMCHNSTDQPNLISPQSTTVLTCHSMPSQNTHNSVMTNLMQPTAEPIHISRSSPVAVKNMILNAAADILSSQPSQITADQTINALISLNTESLLNEQPTAVQPLLMTSSVATTVSSPQNSVMLHGSDRSPIVQSICNQTSIDQRMPLYTEQSVMNPNSILPNSVEIPTNNNPMLGMVTQEELLTQEMRNDQLRRAQQDFLTDYQKNIHKIGGTIAQDSILQAVSLVRSNLPQLQQQQQQQSKAKNDLPIVSAEMQLQPNPIAGAVPQTNAATGANIPQEIATMSDNDLIRYINPSCFDQV